VARTERIIFRESLEIDALVKTLNASGYKITQGVVRMWELRYGFPVPDRLPNNYRVYSVYMCGEIQCLLDALRFLGHTVPISTIIRNRLAGKPWPATAIRTTLTVPEAKQAPDGECVQQITRLSSFFRNQDEANIIAAMHQYKRLRPVQRAYLFDFIKTTLAIFGDLHATANEYKSMELFDCVIRDGAERTVPEA